MKIEFSEEEVKELLIKKAAEIGLEANTVDVDVSFSRVRSATVYFVNPALPTPSVPETTTVIGY